MFVRASLALSSLLPIVLTTGCFRPVAMEEDDADSQLIAERSATDWPDFPAERDLAILMPLQEVAVIPADTPLGSGDVALPRAWVDAVGAAYGGTIVEDGFAEESWYEDWRLVSVRVSPCAPVGIAPGLAPASVCWPTVRVVWQPVVDFMDRGGVQIDAWADDRAMHAIYPVQPRDPAGRRLDPTAMNRVTDALGDGKAWADVPDTERAAFEQARDRTASWLLDRVAALRDPSLPVGSWDGIDSRPEASADAASRGAFAARLTGFLGETATPRDLRELTAFSLPAGRQPSGDDAWVFVQFTSDGDEIRQRSLEVVSRRTGELLLDHGLAQDAGQTRESPEVEAALRADPGGELHETVVSSSTDIDEIADLITDPTQVYVPNTTCATCHRLNGLRFDFHSLSHFEDNDHTVSPRVEADVARDRAWTEAWLAGAAWDGDDSTPNLGGDDPDDEGGSDETPSWEPNESVADAVPLSLPVDVALELTPGDVDHFSVDVDVPTEVMVRIAFSHADGDLDLTLLDSSGQTIASSASTADEERVTVTLPAGRTVIRVHGFQGASGDYRLQVR